MFVNNCYKTFDYVAKFNLQIYVNLYQNAVFTLIISSLNLN